MSDNSNVLVKVGALWQNEKDGEMYFTGALGDARLVVLPNGYKQTEKHPDYIVYVTNRQKREEQQSQPAPEEPEIPF